MSTKTTGDKPHAENIRTPPFRLGVVFLATVVIAVGLLTGVQADRPDAFVRKANSELDKGSARAVPGAASVKSNFNVAESAGPQQPATAATPAPMSTAPPPSNIQIIEPQNQSITSEQSTSAAGRPVFIGFDGLPYSVQTDPEFDRIPLSYTIPSNQFPDVIFSSTSGYHVATYGRPYGTNLPSITRAQDFYNGANHFVPLIVEFPRGVNDLAFDTIGVDYTGVIALMDIYQNRAFSRTVNLPGGGNPYFPVRQTAASALTNVTKVVVHTITDGNGIGFDNFSFNVPSPTPTPVPSPSPSPLPSPSPSPTAPPPPTGVKATPDEDEIFLSWTPTAGAERYIIERTDVPAEPDNAASAYGSANATTPIGPAFVPINSGFICNPVDGRCTYRDDDLGAGLSSERAYSYIVKAVNVAGAGQPSNPPVSAVPLRTTCSEPTKLPPNNGVITKFGWFMRYTFSPRDGLVITDVSLNGKLMAKQMSVPYFRISAKTVGNSSVSTRGELTPAGAGATIRSRLIDYFVTPQLDSRKILVRAKYAVERIPGAPKACLTITQDYEFYANGFGPPEHPPGPCEPSSLVNPCHRFRPMIKYDFAGKNGEVLESLNTPMRLHFQNTVDTGKTGNTVALTRDLDLRDLVQGVDPFQPFKLVKNPLDVAWWGQVIVRRSTIAPNKDNHSFDNLHQTNRTDFVELPGVKIEGPTMYRGLPIVYFKPFGCPECVHFHWRWSNFIPGASFFRGQPIIPPGDQTVDLQIVPYRGDDAHDLHPDDYVRNVYVPGAPLRNPAKGVNKPYDVVFWYSPTGFARSDTFFWHTAWFTPERVEAQKLLSPSPSDNFITSGVQDGPVSLSVGSVYATGDPVFASYNLSTLPPLPAGYAALNNTAYLVDTTGVVSGPYVVNFSAASVADQNEFNNLRIFYAELDPFDPEKLVWTDVTILAPDSPVPNYSAKTLSGRSNALGIFAIGRFVQNVPPANVAELSLSCTDSLDPITAGNNLTYTLTVSNGGPHAATEVALKNTLSPDVSFVSVLPSQGTCKEFEGVVYCQLNTLAAGASAAITLVVQPTERTGSFPPEGKMIANTAIVRAKEQDSDANNDRVVQETNVLPSPNQPPVVNITSPSIGALFVGPATVTINAVASDSDGFIDRVEFFDNTELIGTGIPAGGGSYSITKTILPCDTSGHTGHDHSDHHHDSPCGTHTLIAVATDGGGRRNVSSPVDIIVNGSASINITSPTPGALVTPGSNLTLAASASLPSGSISKLEFHANGRLIGTGVSNGNGQFSFNWTALTAGAYFIVAVVTDGAGMLTTSAPVSLTVNTPPTVVMSTPTDGAVFPPNTNLTVAATAQSDHSSVAKVDFYANGVLIGSSNEGVTNSFMATWRNVADGFYSLTAVATDSLGLTAGSPPVRIGVNAVPTSGQLVWFDDSLPAGAIKNGDTDVDWYWVEANPGSFSGTKSHQSRNFAQLPAPGGIHQHSFDGATQKLPVNVGDKLFTYVFLDINNMPREIMLAWKDASGWAHRARWGGNNIQLGVDNKPSRRYMGPLPKAGQWVRLEVPASAVGLEGTTLDGMAFILDGGRATWDLTGKTTSNAPPPPTSPPGDFVWIEDGLPAGAIPALVDDVWNWVPGPVNSGQSAHQSFFRNNDDKKFRSHSFTGAQTPMMVNPGDVLFTYVYLGDPDLNHQPFTPDQIMLQWYDGASWEHRAFWGENYIGQQIPNVGVQGTENQRYMGGLPAARGWYRLEVPASYVGLEGKSVSGMAFSVFRNEKNPFVTWDRSGRSSQLTTVPLPLSATSGVWLSKSPSYGYGFETNDQGLHDHFPQQENWFFVHPNQAAGTVPFYRFRHPQKHEYFYSRFRDAHPTWTYAGIAFYVYPDESTPGTAPLHLFHDNDFHYFLSTNRENLPGMTYDGVWAYVFSANPQIPTPPSSLTLGACALYWRDNSSTETGFRIEEYSASTDTWNLVATKGVNSTHYCFGEGSSAAQSDSNLTTIDCGNGGLCATSPGYKARVQAFNGFGHSAFSNIVQRDPDDALASTATSSPVEDPPTSTPYVGITSPANSELVDQTFAIFANAFDTDGNGTIVKVEFFADGNKVGEIRDAPYIFVWKNVAPGTYSLTATATDNAGATATSSPVIVTRSNSNSSLRLDSATPAVGRSSGGQQFNLYGAFPGLTTVTLGGAPATWSYTNGSGDTSQITVTTPAHSIGAVPIDLGSTSNGNYSRPNAFAYLPTIFTDDVLVIGFTTIKPQHILELRQAVDAMRAVAGLAPAPWTDQTVTTNSTFIKALHIQELRTYLNDTAGRLGYPTSPYTDPSLTTSFGFMRIHIEELRQRIRTIAG